MQYQMPTLELRMFSGGGGIHLDILFPHGVVYGYGRRVVL